MSQDCKEEHPSSRNREHKKPVVDAFCVFLWQPEARVAGGLELSEQEKAVEVRAKR